MPSSWNSLEIAKLVISVLTPAAIAHLGIYIHHVSKRFEARQWSGQKLIERRLAIYDDLAPHFNDLLCYFTYVGCWTDLNPQEIVALKRMLDRKFYLAAPLFPPSFFGACQAFQSLCFQTYQGWGQDARLRTGFVRCRNASKAWTEESEDCFSEKAEVVNPELIRVGYTRVMLEFTQSFGVICEPEVLTTGQVPGNIR